MIRHASLGTVEQTTEVALDLTCNSLLVMESCTQGRRVLTSSFFDASRERLVSLLRLALPDAADLAKLQGGLARPRGSGN